MAQLMMYWLPGTPVKQFPLPEGYSISNYKQESDKMDWLRICQNGLCDGKDDVSAFDGCITRNPNIDLYKDVFFIDYNGEHVGTTTAYTIPHEGGYCTGDMHMVSIRTDFRGKGLGKFLTMITLNHLKDVPNLRYIDLTTDDWRRPAVKGYLDGGFQPVDREPAARDRWQAILDDPLFKREELQLINLDLTKGVLLKKNTNRGKVFAIGGGFRGESGWQLAERACQLSAARYPNILLIPTTNLDLSDGDALEIWGRVGGSCDTLCLTSPACTEELIAEKLHSADVIFIPDGNAKLALDAWQKTAFVKYLKEVHENGKVIVGSGAGALCLFAAGMADCGRRKDFRPLAATGLVPGSLGIHYNVPKWNDFGKLASLFKCTGIALEDGAALSVVDGHASVLVDQDFPCARAWIMKPEQNYRPVDLIACPEELESL